MKIIKRETNNQAQGKDTLQNGNQYHKTQEQTKK